MLHNLDELLWIELGVVVIQFGMNLCFGSRDGTWDAPAPSLPAINQHTMKLSNLLKHDSIDPLAMLLSCN